MADPILVDQQRQLMAFLQDPQKAVPDDFTAPSPDQLRQRAEIYRNAYIQRLIGALDTDHPMFTKLARQRLGPEGFSNLAKHYIARYPSNVSSLRDFGSKLPLFLTALSVDDFPDASAWADLTQFERALLDTFDAPDSPQLQATALAQIPRDSLAATGFRLHRSVRVFVSDWNAVRVWQMLKGDSDVPQWVSERQHWLLWRSRDRVSQFRHIDPASALFVQAIRRGETVEEACGSLVGQIDTTQIPVIVSRVLSLLFGEGAVSEIKSLDPIPTD